MADYIGATPQENPFMGLLAERLKQAQQFAAKPFGYQNPPAEMLMNLLGIPAVQQTAERIAYGEPMTTGRGMTTQVRPEVMEAAMTVAPAAGLLGRGVERGAMAAGRAGERYAEKVVPQIMERGGMPAQLLGDLSQGSIRPMDVWHGSPHIFNKFDAAKMGTGEGAQMYGQGTYLAQQQEVAKRFTPRDTNFEDALMKKYNQAEKSGDYASMQVYEDFLTQKTPEEIALSLDDMGFTGKDLDSAKKAFESAKKIYQEQTKGALYKVDLPDVSIGKMLDWDAQIKDQSSNIKALAEKYGVDATDLGGDLAFKIGKTQEGQKIMQENGITGIKYFDQMSRGDQSNTRNFVVFDPEQLNILERNAKPVEGLLGQSKTAFDVSRKDASEIFGAGAERVMYKDPKSGGTMEVLAKPDGTASVLSLEVPETSRGKGIGQSLQAQVMQDFPEMMGQVSSKAAAKTAYRLGRRPPFNPDATLDDVYKMMDENSSVNLVSPEMQKRFKQSLLD